MLEFVIGVGLGKILTGMLYECGVLGDILFICIGFIRVWVGVGWFDRVGRKGVELG